MRVELDGVVLAETTRARLLSETGLHTRFYVPRDDVRVDLRPSARTSYCPYKGSASYWSRRRRAGHRLELRGTAPRGRRIAGLVAFWDERVDVYLDGVERPRPGGPFAAALRDEFGV